MHCVNDASGVAGVAHGAASHLRLKLSTHKLAELLALTQGYDKLIL